MMKKIQSTYRKGLVIFACVGEETKMGWPGQFNQGGQGDISLVTAEDEIPLLQCELHGDDLSSRDLLPAP
jgi:hypothetical protein